MHPFTATLTVEGYLHGVRIDSFLVRHFRNYTSYRMQRLVRAGQVRIEGAAAHTSDRVYKGQVVQVRLLEPPDHLLPAEPRPLDILHEDPWLVVVNKPAGIVAHPCGNYSSGSLANALQFHFDAQSELRGLVRPGIVHRLDRLTSGVIVCTRDHLAHRRLSIHFQEGRIAKSYLALVYGVAREDRGEVDRPIGQASAGNTIVMSTAPNAIDARAARTRYTVQERFSRHSLICAQPLTGRLHQIRVHLASTGHPILADEFYGPSAVFKRSDARSTVSNRGDLAPRDEQEAAQPLLDDLPDGDVVLMNRQALHAWRLSFIHPIRRELMTFEAPLPPDMLATLAELRAASHPPEA